MHNRVNLRVVTQQMVDRLRTALELGVRLVPGRNFAPRDPPWHSAKILDRDL
jgi:hypothetical protein